MLQRSRRLLMRDELGVSAAQEKALKLWSVPERDAVVSNSCGVKHVGSFCALGPARGHERVHKTTCQCVPPLRSSASRQHQECLHNTLHKLKSLGSERLPRLPADLRRSIQHVTPVILVQCSRMTGQRQPDAVDHLASVARRRWRPSVPFSKKKKRMVSTATPQGCAHERTHTCALDR